MYITNVNRVEKHKINEKGAQGVWVKYLLHKGVGADKLQLRLFTIEVGGYTPLEKHAHEHEVYVLSGKCLVKGGNQEAVVKAGDVIFIPSYEPHQFKNTGKEPVKFLCTKETKTDDV